MSTPIRIHQLYHRYRRGHEQVASSTILSQDDSDIITRLSDLSGTPLSGFAFDSYLSMYPLPSSRFYALALTRPDFSAPRTGCVLTHTLLLEMDEWSTLPTPKEISSLFFKRAEVPDTITVLEYTPGISIGHTQQCTVLPEDEDFVSRYFGEGIRPVIWFDALDADVKLWKIITGLWPALRCSFSACTLCLQPRSLQGRIFDLMFAPRVASSRFSRLSVDHFIESSTLAREPWQVEFAKQLFGGQTVDLESKRLISVLEDNPSSIQKIYLFQELWKRSSEKPTAAIGAFDLLESINAPETVSQLQKIALKRAVSSFDSLASNERLELFSMLLLRISRVHNEGYRQEEFFKNLLASVMGSVLNEFPQEVLCAIERMWPNLKIDKSLKAAFMGEIEVALMDNSSLSVAIAGCSDIGKELLAEYTPSFAKALYAPGGEVLREQTSEWLSETSFRELLPKFRVSLLNHLKIDQDITFFRKALTDVRKEEVASLLNLLLDINLLTYEKNNVREAIIDSIVRPYPIHTRDWIESLDHRNEIMADVASVTYPPHAAEYREVLHSFGSDPRFQRSVFANWIVRNSAHNSYFISEIAEMASHDSIILASLIDPECEEMHEKALQIIIDSLGSVLPVSESLLQNIFLYQSNNTKLIDIAIRSAMTDYVRSGENVEALEKVIKQKRFLEWLDSGHKWRLAGMIRGDISDTGSCSRGWELFFKLLDLAFGENNLINSLESLIAVTAKYWSLSILNIWINILRRAQDSFSDTRLRVDLCGQAVLFAFENPLLPTSGLVVEGFMPLYKSVTEGHYTPDTAAPLFSYWNWDKGRDLREALVEKFIIGKWPPGDLGRAVSDFGLLKKILKRMSRKSEGRSFSRKMYLDLASKDDNESHSIAITVANLLKDADYEEEWV